MGFFSSRKSEPTPVPRHDKERSSRDGSGVSGSPVAVIKSRWYSKSRSKTAPDPPRPDDSMDTEVTLRLDAYKRCATPAEAESSRGQTDTVTKTMAERLNELTKSHAEGMIDDETYRDLRASLFERFGAASHTTLEQTHVRISGDPTLHTHPTPSSKRHSIGRPDSNFHLAPRPPSMSLSRPQTPSGPAHSIRSTTSRASTVATAVTGLLRRGTKNRHVDQQSISSRPGSPDNASMFSATSSSAPQNYPRAYPGSSHSLASAGGARAPSLSSRRTGRSGLTSRTFATPPSSYHRHGYAYTATGASSSTGMDTDARSKTESEMSMSADLSEYDDKSPQELREAMARTEREGRKLLDAFNGLELTVLTKYRGTGGAMGMAGVGGVGPVTGWTHVNPPGEFGERHSISTRRRPSQMKGKGSASSLYTAPVPGLPPAQLHPNKARSLSLSGQNAGSTTSLRSRSPQPATVQEEGFTDDPEMAQLHKEMEDIRRRRAQVASRYETRLEMLRVKLKSAELRDKVAR